MPKCLMAVVSFEAVSSHVTPLYHFQMPIFVYNFSHCRNTNTILAFREHL